MTSQSGVVGHTEIVQILLAKGADVHAKDKDDWTPLIWAAAKGHGGIVQILLAKGADVHGRDKWGRTPIMMAERERHGGIVQMLKHAAGQRLK